MRIVDLLKTESIALNRGPANKTAYVFGTVAIASGNYDVMATGSESLQ